MIVVSDLLNGKFGRFVYLQKEEGGITVVAACSVDHLISGYPTHGKLEDIVDSNQIQRLKWKVPNRTITEGKHKTIDDFILELYELRKELKAIDDKIGVMLSIVIGDKVATDQDELYTKLIEFTNNTDRLFRIKLICGWGKSYVLAHVIRDTPFNYIYCTIDHRACENFCQELANVGVTYTHFWGKRNPNHILCENPTHAYYPGCISEIYTPGYFHNGDNYICPYRTNCAYHRQRRDTRVIVTTFEDLELLFDESRIVILDESPEKLMVKTLIAPQYYVRNQIDDHRLLGADFIDMPSGPQATKVYPELTAYSPNFSDVGVVNDQWWRYERGIAYHGKIKYRKGNSKLFFTQLTPNFNIHDENTHMLGKFFNETGQRCGYPTPNGPTRCFGRANSIIPPLTRKIIFSCATTTIPFMNEMLGVADQIFGNEIILENEVIKINHGWSKAFTYDHYEWFKSYILALKEKGKKIFIATKKEFAVGEKGTTLDPDVNSLADLGFDCAWYGYGRGFNDYNKEYDMIIAFGSYHFPPEVNKMYELCGVNSELVEQMCQSEVTQTIMRARPFNHPKGVILLMTNDNVITPTSEISLRAFELFIAGNTTKDITSRDYKNEHRCGFDTYTDVKILDSLFE